MNGKKTQWLRTLKILAVLLPAILLILFMPTGDFEDAYRIQHFYLEEPDSLDVVVLGASDVYAGYSPVLAYEEYGFTSYGYVLSGNYIHLFPAQLEQIQQVQSPELIVIEITEAVHEKTADYDKELRQLVAGTPFSRQKIDLINALGDPEHLLSYYFPFCVHHGSLDLGASIENAKTEARIRSRGYSLLKGTLTFTGSGENWDGPYVTPVNTTNDHSKTEIPPIVAQNFENFLTYCREHSYTNLLFVNFPHRISDEDRYRNYQITNAVGDLIESYGYDFINLESMLDDIGIVPETDFYNNDHMNLYGQYKVTRFLCDILVNEYGVEGRQLSALSKEKWDTCVEYNHLYYALFDREFKARDPEEFGLWLKESDWLLSELEQMRSDSAG